MGGVGDGESGERGRRGEGDLETERRRDGETGRWVETRKVNMQRVKFDLRFSPFFKGRCPKDRGVQKVQKELLTPKL